VFEYQFCVTLFHEVYKFKILEVQQIKAEPFFQIKSRTGLVKMP
jgi:hypothetical protein